MTLTADVVNKLLIIQGTGCPACEGGRGNEFGRFLVYTNTAEQESWMTPNRDNRSFGFTWKVHNRILEERIICSICSATLLNITKNEWSKTAEELIEQALATPKKLAAALYKMSNDFAFFSDEEKDTDACTFLVDQYKSLYKEYLDSLKRCNLLLPNFAPPLNPDSLSFDNLDKLGMQYQANPYRW